MPVCHCSAFSIVQIEDISSGIISLYKPSCPLTVFFRIAFVIIFSFYRMLWRWPWTNVSIKSLEITEPFLAHSNASTAISFVLVVFFIITTLLNTFPDRVFRASVHSVFSTKFPFVAPAAYCGSFLENVGSYRNGFTTSFVFGVAQTIPSNVSVIAIDRISLNNEKSSKSLPCKIF